MSLQITPEVDHLGSPTSRMRIANSISVYIAYIPIPYYYGIIHYSIASHYIYILVLRSSYAHVIKLRYIYIYILSVIPCWGQTIYIYYSMYYTYQSFVKILHIHITTIYIFTVQHGSQRFMFILHIQPSYRIMHRAILQGLFIQYL